MERRTSREFNVKLYRVTPVSPPANEQLTDVQITLRDDRYTADTSRYHEGVKSSINT